MEDGLETRVALKRSHERIIAQLRDAKIPNPERENERVRIKGCSEGTESLKKLPEFWGWQIFLREKSKMIPKFLLGYWVVVVVFN